MMSIKGDPREQQRNAREHMFFTVSKETARIDAKLALEL